jgi:Txe/YoeB family toxin of Txe-Axe toxin-antitoxin module
LISFVLKKAKQEQQEITKAKRVIAQKKREVHTIFEEFNKYKTDLAKKTIARRKNKEKRLEVEQTEAKRNKL